MKSTVAETFLLLARCRTPEDRTRVLHGASTSARFNDEQREELRALASERDHSSIHALRPLSNPVLECKYLESLELTQRPILPETIEAEIDEWVNGWRHATDLELAGMKAPGALLLHGPTGSGKSMLCGTLAGSIGRTGVVAECHNLVDSHMGCTGERLGQAFKAAGKAGSVFVIEELDALAAHRGGTGEGAGATQENARITVALMRMIESARFPIVATTNRIEALDPALLRRFEY